MRLFNCITKKLEEYAGHKVPPYAILSHTWGENEVSYRDLMNIDPIEYEGRASWSKIKRCCEQALDDNLDYLWADTVCIDKSSSAELSEAINSMFKWYRDAKVCYAFLSDLDDGDGNATGLENCRWFTRGWTLQEMIAAEDVQFYDKNWVFQGSKNNLLDRINQITGVDQRALRGGNLRFFSVARKMSWASNRKTTRIEDIAYCLLGIFDISMPLLYGEGSRAFVRLQEEITKQYDDESLFAWTSNTIGETSGLLAPNPTSFASSSDVVPCLTGDHTQGLSSPIKITSRGVQMKVAIEEIPGATDGKRGLYLFRLNCKRVAFDRENGTRMGILVTKVAKIEGYESDVSMYTRVYPNRLDSFQPRNGLGQRRVFLLKENRLQDFDLGSYDVFLIRTMPDWPSGCEFQLVNALPAECWDSRNDTFKRKTEETVSGEPFVLIFRRDDPLNQAPGYFIVAMGRTINSDHVQKGNDGGSFWCGATYCRGDDELIVQKEGQKLRPDLGQEQKTVVCEGAGVILKCHVRPEVMSGQQLFFMDLLVDAAVLGSDMI